MDSSRPEAQGWFPALLDELLEGFQVIGPDLRYRYVNRVAAQHGRTTAQALLGHTMAECYPGIESTGMFALLRRCLTERTPHAMENEFVFPDGRKGVFELRMEPVPQGVCVLSIDVTHRKECDERLRAVEADLEASRRMDAIGQLAAGVAHDFKNLLSVILGTGAMALQRDGGPLAADVRNILDAARRATDLTRQLLACGRRQVLRPEVLDAARIVADIEPLLRAALGADIDLRVDAPSRTTPVAIDRGKFEQAIVNLVLNARDSMRGSGRVVIRVREVDPDPEFVAAHPDARAGRQIAVEVGDDGAGMDAATRARLFEPFFSTKTENGGTGLGLATVHGFIRQSGGSIVVASEPGRGTDVVIHLPIAPAGLAAGTPRDPAAAPSLQPSRPANESILLVEDDPHLAELATTILEQAGYAVTACANAGDALGQLALGTTFDLLITDLVMPGMSGAELVAHALQMRPQLRVLCTSGLPQDAMRRAAVWHGSVEFLEKPYLPDDLLAAVRRELSVTSPPR
ncbi:MAG: response regulator [Planctomycetes bacterium]|nr:response regulator [Planctomycetota bacterium]